MSNLVLNISKDDDKMFHDSRILHNETTISSDPT